jgi:hypothetical protein
MNALAEVNEPLVLADGTKINPADGTVIEDAPAELIEIPSHSQAVALITKTRRRIADLPDIPQRMHVIGAVLSYRLFGLDDTEIALATGMTEEQIGRIIVSDAYTSLHEKAIEGILSSDAENVRNLFAQGARKAAQTVTKLSTLPNALGFRAAKDVLDRAGMRPADVVEHRHKLDGELHIVHIRKDTRDELPVVEGLTDVLAND